jgi:cephalosporin hydroxylase
MTKPGRKKIMIDLERGEVRVTDGESEAVHAIGTPEAFEAISHAWLRAGWDNKYVYTFSWLGRPIIQLPEDMMRIQEVIYSLQPDVMIETGVAHGGSVIFYASLCQLMGRGRVIGIDVEIRPANRAAIESHTLASYITLIERSSTAPETLAAIKQQLTPGEKVLVLLDSRHAKEHVLDELNGYAPFVTPGSYIVAMDGIMQDMVGAPRTQSDWSWNNPQSAAREFVESNPNFVIEEPQWNFNESSLTKRVTYWPSAFIKRRESDASETASLAPAGWR